MENDTTLLQASKTKVISSIQLVEASMHDLKPFDDKIKYSPKELEPYDALADRFIRAVENCIKFFRTYDYYLNVVKTESYRNLLLDIEKLKIITSVDLWIDMRDIRNRIVHEYLPDQVKNIFDQVMNKFKNELFITLGKVKEIRYDEKI